MLQAGLAAQAISQSRAQGTKMDQVAVFEQALSELEQTVFHQQYNKELITSRIARLEKKIFGGIQSGSFQHRIDALIVHESDNMPVSPESSAPKQNTEEAQPTASSHLKKDSSIHNKQVAPRDTNKQVVINKQAAPTEMDKQAAINKRAIEQVSWDASMIIDQLLKAQDSADSVALDEAVSKLDQISQVHSDPGAEQLRTAAMYRERGVAAYGQGKFVEAVSNFKQAQNLSQWDATILNDLVTSLIKTNDLKTAILYGPVAVSIVPSSTIAWCNMAQIFARAKQYSRARGCAYIACLMGDTADKTLSTMEEIVSDIDEPEVRAPFKESLFIAQYTLKDFNKSGDIGQAKYIGPDSDTALYKANMLLLFAPGFQQIKSNSGIVLVVTVSESGQVIKDEVLRSSGDTELDKTAMKAITDAKLLPLPKSSPSDRQQFIVPVDKVVLALADKKHN